MSTFDSVEKVDPEIVAEANATLAQQVLSALEIEVERRVMPYLGYENLMVFKVGGKVVKEVLINREYYDD